MEMFELLLGIKQGKLDLEATPKSEWLEIANTAITEGLILLTGEISQKGLGWLELKRRDIFCHLADKEWRIIRSSHNNVFMRCGPGAEWEGHKAAFAKRGDYERIAILQDYILMHGDAKQKAGVN